MDANPAPPLLRTLVVDDGPDARGRRRVASRRGRARCYLICSSPLPAPETTIDALGLINA